MTDKALISTHTWRTLESQRSALAGMPAFVIPDDLPQIFRPSTRSTIDRLHVEALGVIAKTESDFREFLKLAKQRKSIIVSREDGREFAVNGNSENIVKWWKDSRRKDAGEVGAAIGLKRNGRPRKKPSPR